MVRYYGIYARPVREKIHALVATVLKKFGGLRAESGSVFIKPKA